MSQFLECFFNAFVQVGYFGVLFSGPSLASRGPPCWALVCPVNCCEVWLFPRGVDGTVPGLSLTGPFLGWRSRSARSHAH